MYHARMKLGTSRNWPKPADFGVGEENPMRARNFAEVSRIWFFGTVACFIATFLGFIHLMKWIFRS